ncbi:MAG TPA: hypothetical protein DCE42_20865 [Myxococcales bacterium]|nr:hypothetical protein [Myxococcales bacterium]
MKKSLSTRNTILLLLGIAVFVFCGFGCATTSNTKKQHTIQVRQVLKAKDYFPLRVGDKRVYRVRFAQQTKTQKQVVRVIRQKGQRFFDDQKQFYEYDSYGLRSNRRYLLKYPLRVGTRWFSVVGTYASQVERNVIVGVNSRISTPAGVYERCIVVRSQDSQGKRGVLEGMFHFAPGVGLAKVSTVLKTQGRRIPQWTLELVSFEAGKGGGTNSKKVSLAR